MGASVTLGATGVAVQPGAEAAVELRLRNTGDVVDEFSLDVLGDSATWAAVEPATVSLFPGAEATARIVFRPPRASPVPAGPMPYGLRARSREDPAGSSVEEGVVDVAPFHDPFAELVPRTSRGSRGGTHELALDNRGNVRLSAEIEASDADRLLRFDVDPPAFVVDPGQAGFSKLRVIPAQRFWRGQPKTRPFQVAVRPEGAPFIALDGSLLQEAILPRWFGRAVAALAALAVALVGAWLFVLQPSIMSAAAEAVESPISELRDDVSSALEAAGLPPLAEDGGAGEPSGAPPSAPAASADGAPSPGDGGPGPASPAPPGPFIPGLGNAVDGRLSEGAPSITPAGGTLFITDLVFSNPNGREGTITLDRDGSILYQDRLENFRLLDIHQVTPLVVGPGQTLTLTLSCTSAPPCDPTFFYSGYLRP